MFPTPPAGFRIALSGRRVLLRGLGGALPVLPGLCLALGLGALATGLLLHLALGPVVSARDTRVCVQVGHACVSRVPLVSCMPCVSHVCHVCVACAVLCRLFRAAWASLCAVARHACRPCRLWCHSVGGWPPAAPPEPCVMCVLPPPGAVHAVGAGRVPLGAAGGAERWAAGGCCCCWRSVRRVSWGETGTPSTPQHPPAPSNTHRHPPTPTDTQHHLGIAQHHPAPHHKMPTIPQQHPNAAASPKSTQHCPNTAPQHPNVAQHHSPTPQHTPPD